MAAAFAFANLCRCGKVLKDCAHPKISVDQKRVELAATAEPVSYDLALVLQLEEHTFSGKVAVEVELTQMCTSLTLNAKELTFVSASYASYPIFMEATKIEVDEESTTVKFTFPKALPKGKGMLSIVYDGLLNNQMNGLYRSTYVDIDGNKKLMASTQFEPVSARRCFPCFDEPRRKATFTCSLRVPSHMTALSNMPEAQTRNHGDGTRTFSFMPTPRMSTYLLAFVVGEFDLVSALTKHGVLIRVFVPPGKPELGTFALRCATQSLDLYDEAFDVPYPLPKSDMVAIPEFAAGAMENWGLVTYREVDLLIDEANASSRQLQRVAEVVIHELAHQWFGNLVTMEWWDDLWLNEGFATWMEHSICAELFPNWRMWESFVVTMQGQALALDALRSSHPIQVPIEKAEEVEQVFDAISYCKGGAVVRMVYAVVGKDKFYEGLRRYMKSFQYGNATTADLWAAWEEASGQPISSLMGQWTKQMGFPVVEVKSAKAAADGSVALELSQEWFLADGSPVAAADAKTWTVPLFIRAAGADAEEPMRLMDGATYSCTVAGDGAWVKLNASQEVPMRVKYPAEMVPQLAAAIRSKALPPLDRIGVLSDYAALCKAGKVDPVSYLDVLSAYADEEDATVLDMLLEKLLQLHGLLQGSRELSAAFDGFAATIVQPQLAAIGWDPKPEDGHLTRKLRGQLISALPAFCAADAAVQTEARRRFDQFVADPAANKAALPSEYMQAVFKLVMAAGGEAEFEQLLSLFEQLPLNDDKKQAICALGAAPTAALRTRALEFSISGAVKLQDCFYIALTMHGASPDGMDATWDFFTAQLPRYKALLGDASPSLMDAVITGACRGFASAARAAEVAFFFEATPIPSSTRKIEQLVEGIATNAKFLDAFLASDAQQWLAKPLS